MAIFKCKMCGGDLDVQDGMTVCECEYCGTKQTLPKLDDERKINLYDRANHFRRNNEYDKAMSIYEQILSEDTSDAEAYWSLVLCKYGIEYVDDPMTRKKVPTVNRTQFTSIFADEDYKSAIKYSDTYQKSVYENEARAIDEIQKGILAISAKEEPFDVFVCYKETDSNGRRTPDSVLATELYHELTKEGFKVFFSRITLEDKLGTAYEPYIFAALNSSKVMVVLGTKLEYFNAVWVKNEWSRYLSLIKNGANKVLIPAYRDMDPYDLPEEFSHLQAQDMSKLGFMQDLIHGIKKYVTVNENSSAVKKIVVDNNANISGEPLLKRAFIFLEDNDWRSADEYCEKVLDQDPENSMAYLGKLMASLKVSKQENLKNCENPFDDNINYKKIIRYGDKSIVDKINTDIKFINDRNENARKNAILTEAKSRMNGEQISSCESAIKLFESIPGWKDADVQVDICKNKIKEIKAKEEADRLEQEQIAEQKRIESINKAKKIKKAIILVVIALLVVTIVASVAKVVKKSSDYKKAEQLFVSEQYLEAYNSFASLGDYKDSGSKCRNIIKDHLNSSISAGTCHTVGLKSDGTVVATGKNDYGQCDVDEWNDIIAISAGPSHTVGLKSDGTVVATGDKDIGQCDVDEWNDIIAISAGMWHTVGLKLDGAVVATGDNDDGQCNVNDWNDIIAISAGKWHTVGLKSDGTVVATGENDYGQCDVNDWNDIIAISAGKGYTVGLKSDGTVVATGDNDDGQCDVNAWNDIVEFSAGMWHTVGLKSDGTVVTTGCNDDGQCDVNAWNDIVKISAGYNHTVGLKSDGTVVATGYNDDGQCDVDDWKDIKIK